VVEANDGGDALRKLAGQPLDIIITDSTCRKIPMTALKSGPARGASDEALKSSHRHHPAVLRRSSAKGRSLSLQRLHHQPIQAPEVNRQVPNSSKNARRDHIVVAAVLSSFRGGCRRVAFMQAVRLDDGQLLL